MSTFAVTVERISKILPAENSDNLELGFLEDKDYQFVVKKGEYAEGSLVVYFPVDSVFPVELSDRLGITQFLHKQRVKTIKLRGNISQGLVLHWFDVLNHMPMNEVVSGLDVTEYLGITKYEIPFEVGKDRPENLMHLPNLVNVYDIESAQNFPALIQELMNHNVWVSEKIEGTHFWYNFEVNDEGKWIQHYGSRRFEIKPGEDNKDAWSRVASDHELMMRLISINNTIVKAFEQRMQKVHSITYRAELVGPGIRKNYYDLKNYQLFFFDIEVNGKAVSFPDFTYFMQDSGLSVVPILFTGRLYEYLGDKHIVEMSNGESVIADKLREGIVLKPQQEMWDSKIGRLFVKVRSPEYLEKSGM